MTSKLLITPVITPRIPDETELQGDLNGTITVHTAESGEHKVGLKDGVPEHFHTACRKLLSSFSGKANAVLV